MQKLREEASIIREKSNKKDEEIKKTKSNIEDKNRIVSPNYRSNLRLDGITGSRSF